MKYAGNPKYLSQAARKMRAGKKVIKYIDRLISERNGELPFESVASVRSRLVDKGRDKLAVDNPTSHVLHSIGTVSSLCPYSGYANCPNPCHYRPNV